MSPVPGHEIPALGGLEDWIRSLVREEVREALAGGSNYLTTAEASALLRIAPGTLRRWVREGRVVPLQAGRELRFQRSDLETLAAPRARTRRVTRQKTPEEIGAEMWGRRSP